MEIFVYNTSEYILLNSFVNERIVFDKKLYSDLQPNYIVYIIENKIAALATISFEQEKNSKYVYQADIEHITAPQHRIHFPFEIQIMNGMVSNDSKEKLLELIRNTEYSFPFYANNAEELLNKEKKHIEKLSLNQTRKIDFAPSIDTIYKNISEPHLKAQYILREIGTNVGYDTFIAKNDQNRIFNNEFLSDGYLVNIPYENLSVDTKTIISLVDVIWFEDNIPKAAFEIETSTSISSGLLRISDLVLTVNPKADIYILTTKERQKKLKKELNRPIFTLSGISQRCKVIYLDDLDRLYSFVKPLNGYIKKNVLNLISHDFSTFDSAMSAVKHQDII